MNQEISILKSGISEVSMMDTKDDLKRIFDIQRLSFERDRNPSAKVRKEKLSLLRSIVYDNRDQIIRAINDDFGNRATEESRLSDIAHTIQNIDYSIGHVYRWMKPRRRTTSRWYKPASNYIIPQPLGVIGIMSPWNYPVNLSLIPLASALAAGNRAMVKMSEYSPATTELIKRLISSRFPESDVAIIAGNTHVAAAFSALPFGHLLFTGSTAVGKKVMATAALNLTPVTLELGGKCPVIIDSGFSTSEAAKRILWGKTFNAGQTCMAPDYVLLQRGQSDCFVEAIKNHYRSLFPDGTAERGYTSIASKNQYDRLCGLLHNAKVNGARIVELEPLNKVNMDQKKFPLVLVINPPSNTRLMNEEIFGPILPVIELENMENIISFINTGEKPLAVYCFTHSSRQRDTILNSTLSGGAAINDVMAQYMQVDLPFGGVGSSGIGRTHGIEGFNAFSNLKSVFVQRGFGSFTGMKTIYPPYTPFSRWMIRLMNG